MKYNKGKPKVISRRTFLKTTSAAAALSFGEGLFPGVKPAFAKSLPDTKGTDKINGYCGGCLYKKCNTVYTVENGVLTQVEGMKDGLYNRGTLCNRGAAQIETLYNPYRIKRPMKRTNPAKGLDEDPGWVEITWEEALATTVKEISKVTSKDPREFVFHSGFGGWHSMLMRPFTIALGSPNFIAAPGSFCSIHSASEIMRGSFIQITDSERTNFKIEIGAGLYNSGHADGASLIEADNAAGRKMRVVKVDPHNSALLSNSEWVPIKPQTDLAFLLAFQYAVLHEIGNIDEPFIKNRTNAPYLVGSDGHYVRDEKTGKPMMWDIKNSAAKVFDDPTISNPAIRGKYKVNGKQAKPAFELIYSGTKSYTPEWGAEICGISAEKIRALAGEFVSEARIGETIELDGIEFPFRPVAISISRGLSNHRYGSMAYWCAMTTNILVGAFDVPGANVGAGRSFNGAVGEDGLPKVFHFGPHVDLAFPTKSLDQVCYFPYAHDTGYLITESILHPEKYGIDYKPKACITFGVNLFSKGGAEETLSEVLRSFDFTAAISTHMDEHTLFADIVFPEANQFEVDMLSNYLFDRPGYARQNADNHTNARQALVKPLYDGRHVDEILIELASRMGVLTKMNAINGKMNHWDYNPAKRYTVNELYETQLKAGYGPDTKLSSVMEKGYITGRPRPLKETFMYYNNTKTKARIPVYNDHLLTFGEQVTKLFREKGLEPPAGKDGVGNIYRPFPKWFIPPEYSRKGDKYDMNIIGWRIPQFLHDITNYVGNPVLQEMASQDDHYGKVILNTRTAQQKGLKNGDLVYVSNRFGVKVGPAPVVTTETIHPDAVGVQGGHSRRGKGINPVHEASKFSWNRLIPVTWDTIDPSTGAIELSPKVRITKA